MLADIALSDVIDVAFMAFFIHIVLVWFKRTRAAFVLTGIVIIAAIYLLAQQFNLFLTAGVLQGFFAVILLALVIIFQEEIRRFFEQIALWSMNPRLRPRGLGAARREQAALLARTLADLARDRIGALIVLEGHNIVAGHAQGGTELEGKLSEPLLKSLFDPHSEGHDGAVVIAHNRLTRFGTHLPLSKNFRRLEHEGTRHAAALGLAEVTDALCLVVSEERGTISAARRGRIFPVADAEALAALIERFEQEMRPERERRSWVDYVIKNWQEKAIALGLALMLWFVHVYGSEIVYKTFAIPVRYAQLPAELEVASVEPEEVDLTFSGPRRDLTFLNRNRLTLFLKTLNLKPGRQTIRIQRSNVGYPKNIVLETIDPNRVTLQIVHTKMAEDTLTDGERP